MALYRSCTTSHITLRPAIQGMLQSASNDLNRGSLVNTNGLTNVSGIALSVLDVPTYKPFRTHGYRQNRVIARERW